jgi:hypothetical protein
MTDWVRIPERLVKYFRKLRSCSTWYNEIDINSEDEASDLMQYQEVVLIKAENEYRANH